MDTEHKQLLADLMKAVTDYTDRRGDEVAIPITILVSVGEGDDGRPSVMSTFVEGGTVTTCHVTATVADATAPAGGAQ
jgi:hypothetical protein